MRRHREAENRLRRRLTKRIDVGQLCLLAPTSFAVVHPPRLPPEHNNADPTGSGVDLYPHRGLTAAPTP